MKKQILKQAPLQIMLTLFLTTIFLPASSWALFTARASYGLLTSKQDIANLCQGSCTAPANAPAIVPTYGLGLDALVSLPLVPFGFGLRYEKQGVSASASNIEASVNYTRTAVLVNYRLIDTIIHFGPIASYGISHSGNFSIKEGGVTKVDVTPNSMTSYSLGLELEVKPLIVIPIIVGAEFGYMGFKWNNSINSVDSSSKNIDLSGTYMKVFLGLDI